MEEKRIVVIGDIHGEFDTLNALLKKIKKEGLGDPSKDTYVFLGDYIDRGNESKKVISLLKRWKKKYGENVVILRGNHEDMAFESLGLYKDVNYRSSAYSLWQYNGGDTTIESYGGFVARLGRDMQWLFNNSQFFYETDKYFMVHAGLQPGVSIQEHKDMPENVKRGTLQWVRDEFINSDYNFGKKVIFGHTALYPYFEPIIQENKIGIDTAVCAPAHNKLTALILPEEGLVSQNYLGDNPFDTEFMKDSRI